MRRQEHRLRPAPAGAPRGRKAVGLTQNRRKLPHAKECCQGKWNDARIPVWEADWQADSEDASRLPNRSGHWHGVRQETEAGNTSVPSPQAESNLHRQAGPRLHERPLGVRDDRPRGLAGERLHLEGHHGPASLAEVPDLEQGAAGTRRVGARRSRRRAGRSGDAGPHTPRGRVASRCSRCGCGRCCPASRSGTPSSASRPGWADGSGPP